MANNATSKSIQELKNLSADQSVAPHIPREGMMGKASDGSWYNLSVGTDGSLLSKTGDIPYALKVTVVGAVTYIGIANPGTAQATAEWQCKKIDTTVGTVITWADGNGNFDNTSTDLTALSYT